MRRVGFRLAGLIALLWAGVALAAGAYDGIARRRIIDQIRRDLPLGTPKAAVGAYLARGRGQAGWNREGFYQLRVDLPLLDPVSEHSLLFTFWFDRGLRLSAIEAERGVTAP